MEKVELITALFVAVLIVGGTN